MYDVVGVVGSPSSDRSSKISSLLGGFKVPIISQGATANELSDKRKYEYFSRMVPPNKYQVTAIVDLLVHFNWTYISTLATEGVYGQNGITQVINDAKVYGICVAYSEVVRPRSSHRTFDRIAQDLKDNYKAKVVVMFLSQNDIAMLGLALKRKGLLNEFILVTSDSFGNLYKVMGDYFYGTISLNTKSVDVPDFHSYYKGISPWRRHHDNPWFGQYTKKNLKCEWREEVDIRKGMASG